MNVNWSAYAREYDILAELNPAYQALRDYCLQAVAAWPLQAGDRLADFGGGTGNFSVPLAAANPHVEVVHVDSCPEMIEVARHKAEKRGLRNWTGLEASLDDETWTLPPLDGAITVHTLYALPRPHAAIERIVKCLRSGGHLLAADFGRRMNVLDWTTYLVSRSLRAQGLRKTWKRFRDTRVASRENSQIRRCQDTGRYWLHDLAGFRASFDRAGVEVTHGTDRFYRGYDDLIVGWKR